MRVISILWETPLHMADVLRNRVASVMKPSLEHFAGSINQRVSPLHFTAGSVCSLSPGVQGFDKWYIAPNRIFLLEGGEGGKHGENEEKHSDRSCIAIYCLLIQKVCSKP